MTAAVTMFGDDCFYGRDCLIIFEFIQFYSRISSSKPFISYALIFTIDCREKKKHEKAATKLWMVDDNQMIDVNYLGTFSDTNWIKK